MIVGVIATDFGPHSAEDLAISTAAQLISVASEASGLNAAKGRKLELQFIDILEEHHQRVQDHERGQLEEHGDVRLSDPLDPTEHVDEPFDAIIAAAAAVEGARPGTTSAIAKHYADPKVQIAVREVLATMFATNMDIERSWHADRNPDGEHAKAFKARRA